jgi:HEAT repeat protein
VYHYGHDERNDRTFLPPGRPPDGELIAQAIAVLESASEPWPAVMSAGLSLGSLSELSATHRAVPAMGRQLLRHPDFDVRWRMAHSLGRIGAPEAVPYLVKALRDPSFYARDEAAWALARLGAVAVPAVIAELDRLEPPYLPFAALALGLSGDRAGEARAIALMAVCIASGDPGVRRDAVYFAGELADASGAQALLGDVAAQLAGDAVRGAAWSWGMLAARDDGADCAAVRELAATHPAPEVRAEAVVALGRVGRARAYRPLQADVVAALADPAGHVRYAAMQSLRIASEAGSEYAAAAAREHGEDPDFGVCFERMLATDRQAR